MFNNYDYSTRGWNGGYRGAKSCKRRLDWEEHVEQLNAIVQREMPSREKGTEEQLDNSVGDDSDSDMVMTGESTADGAGSGTERRVKVLTLAEARDATETLCLFYKTRISHRPSDRKHSLYWLEEHAKLCRLRDNLTTYREPLAQAAITQFMAPGGGV